MLICETCLVLPICRTACIDLISNLENLSYEDIEANAKKIMTLLKDTQNNFRAIEIKKGNKSIKLEINYRSVGVQWFVDGYAHREDGPAKMWSDGSEYHWLYDTFLWSFGHDGKPVLRINPKI